MPAGTGSGPTADAAADCAACACAYAILIKRRKATASGFGRREMEDGTRDTHDGIDLLSPPTVGYLDLSMWHIEGATCAPQWTTVVYSGPHVSFVPLNFQLLLPCLDLRQA